jgi:hypothetical protein
VAAALAVDLALAEDRRGVLKLLAAAGMLGFLFDTGLAAARVFAPLPHLWPGPWSPPWMISLWLNLAAALDGCLAWLRKRYLLAAALGAVGGPLAYCGGAKLGAASVLPGAGPVLVLAAGWGVMMPLLVWLAGYFI